MAFTNKKTKPPTGAAAHKLTRFEAQRVADYLRRQGVDLPSGWVAIHKLSIQDVMTIYNAPLDALIAEVRLEEVI